MSLNGDMVKQVIAQFIV